MVQGDELENMQDDGLSFEREGTDEWEAVPEDVEDIASLFDESDEYEMMEIEFDEDDIVRYIEDEQGQCIGFVLLEDGEEAEYYYVGDEDHIEDMFADEDDFEGMFDDEDDEDIFDDEDDEDEFNFEIAPEKIAQATQNMNAIYKDGAAVVSELKDAFDDIKSAFDFGTTSKKK